MKQKHILKWPGIALGVYLLYGVLTAILVPLPQKEAAGELWSQYEARLSEDASQERVRSIEDTDSALLWRLQLIESAEREVIFSTFDLRADGSGQLGIEALSRGAARCVFLDENREAVNIVMKNCKNCGVFDRSRVNIGEAARFLSACREQFDLVLLDPPFHNGTLENILPIVDKCVAPGGIVICESETKLVLPAEVGGLQLKKQYKYGKVLLWKYVRPMTDAAEEEGEA